MADQTTPLTMDDLKAKVDNYRAFATKAIAPDDVFVSAVFHRDALTQILNSVPDADGIRIYMTKQTADSDKGDDVSYLMVPVKQENDHFMDQIHDEHALMANNAMLSVSAPCMGPFC